MSTHALNFSVGRDEYRVVLNIEPRYDSVFYDVIIERKSKDALGAIRWDTFSREGWKRQRSNPECDRDSLKVAAFVALALNAWGLDLEGNPLTLAENCIGEPLEDSE